MQLGNREQLDHGIVATLHERTSVSARKIRDIAIDDPRWARLTSVGIRALLELPKDLQVEFHYYKPA